MGITHLRASSSTLTGAAGFARLSLFWRQREEASVGQCVEASPITDYRH